MLLGGTNFSEFKAILKEGQEAVMNGDQIVSESISEVAISYGAIINTVIEFIIIGFAVFMIIREYVISQRKKENAPAPPPSPSKEEALLSEIRDILKEK